MNDKLKDMEKLFDLLAEHMPKEAIFAKTLGDIVNTLARTAYENNTTYKQLMDETDIPYKRLEKIFKAKVIPNIQEVCLISNALGYTLTVEKQIVKSKGGELDA